MLEERKIHRTARASVSDELFSICTSRIMSGRNKKKLLQTKRAKVRAKQDAARIARLKAAGRIVCGTVIPEGAVPADLSRQAPHNSYSPPLYYIDREFTCIDCGTKQVWTAQQQKWYYEVAKGPIYATAIRCRPCRRKQRERAAEKQN